jgi:hypothetical protein
MSAIGSGSPRWNTSRCNCGRFISWVAASRKASSRFKRHASAFAMSSALGPSGACSSGSSKRDFR